MIAKLIRLIERWLFYFSNGWRKGYLRLKYPGLKIDRGTVLQKGCKIICVDGGEIELLNSFISAGVYLLADRNARLKLDHVYVGRYTHIVAKEAITVGYKTAIAEMVVIRDQDHIIHRSHTASAEDLYHIAAITIGKHSWIASKATVLKGVIIGDYAVIAASAVVTKAVPSNEVWAGVPAKSISDNHKLSNP